MPAAKLAYHIDINGTIDQRLLEQIRADLGLRPRGRLTDAEDADFGYRDDRVEATGTLLNTTLWRHGDDAWRISIIYEGERPPQSAIDQYRPAFRAAIERAGLQVVGEWCPLVHRTQFPADGPAQ